MLKHILLISLMFCPLIGMAMNSQAKLTCPTLMPGISYGKTVEGIERIHNVAPTWTLTAPAQSNTAGDSNFMPDKKITFNAETASVHSGGMQLICSDAVSGAQLKTTVSGFSKCTPSDDSFSCSN